MSFKEIRDLRQAGKLDEALQMANQALEAEPDNIWNKRAATWVYYDYLKEYAKSNSFEGFKENLIKIKDLQLPEDEKMAFDNCAWQIGSFVFGLQKTEPIDYSKINELFEIIKDFHFTKPSESYSFLYKAFHKNYQNWINYIQFADWWNFENFSSQDFLPEEFNGKKIMSIVEQAYIAYSKKLIAVDTFGKEKPIDKDKIQSFLPKLDDLIDVNPEYQYPPYYKAKLLMAVGSEENALSAFLPFAKQKRNDFWVWELMGEFFKDDIDIRIACYCKALSLNTPEDFLVKVRQTFADILIEKKLYDEAKTEIKKIVVTRKTQGWKIPNQLTQWASQDWYKSAITKQDNREFYIQHLHKAEEVLYSDVPEEVVVVEFVNSNKKILNFIKDKEKFGFFKYLDFKPAIGDILKVRFQDGNQGGFHKTFTIKKVTENNASEALRIAEGTVRVFEKNTTFAIIDNIFIPPHLVRTHKLQNGDKVAVKAILSFNKNKKEWGWKAIKITQLG